MSDDRNARVIFAIREFVKRYGYAPTIRELAAMLDLGHSSVQAALMDLANDGKIRKTNGVARGVTLKEAR